MTPKNIATNHQKLIYLLKCALLTQATTHTTSNEIVKYVEDSAEKPALLTSFQYQSVSGWKRQNSPSINGVSISVLNKRAGCEPAKISREFKRKSASGNGAIIKS